MKNIITIILSLALILTAIAATADEVFMPRAQFFRTEKYLSQQFINGCTAGFAIAYAGCKKAEDLGHGFCCLPGNNRRGEYQCTWYAFRDGNGLLKVVFNRFVADGDLKKTEEEADLQCWRHSKVESETKNGKVLWDDKTFGRYTTVRSDNPELKLEDLFRQLENLHVVQLVAQGDEPLK